MQYTLPAEAETDRTDKLEAQARKESTLQNAEAAAQAKVLTAKRKSSGRRISPTRKRTASA